MEKNMATRKQIAANQSNAQKSTGPKTAAGKESTKRNAFKHGVFSRELFLPWESEDAFKELFASLVDDLNPEGTTELLLVEQMAVSIWKRARLNGIEAKVIQRAVSIQMESLAHPERTEIERRDEGLAMSMLSPQYAQLIKYQGLLSREQQQTYMTLLARQQERLTIDAEDN